MVRASPHQGIGFGVQHYPIGATTMGWGVVIGAAALIATLAASTVVQAQPAMRAPLALGFAFVAAYAAYELTLFAATPALGGSASFTTAIVARIGLSSAAWLIGLLAICEMLRRSAGCGKSLAS